MTHSHSEVRAALLCGLALAALSCGHARSKGENAQQAVGAGNPAGPAAIDPREAARALSADAHDVLRAEGDLLWKRYTTGSGALPSSAADAHPQLFSARSLQVLAEAQLGAAAEEARALQLLRSWMGPLSVTRAAATAVTALDRGRASLVFAEPAGKEHGERDLDRLLTDEPSATRRAAIAEAEARAATALAPLAFARDAAEAQAMEQLGLPGFADLIEELYGSSPKQLGALAEQTLAATEKVAARAVAMAAQQNLGSTADRVRRADLPRMLRTASADADFPAGHGWEATQATLRTLGADPSAADEGILIDAQLSAAKGARPLALLVDPPRDVRLALQKAAGVGEQRALLHEAARATGGALTRTPRWELAQLGDGSAAEGVAQLFQELAGDPLWLRAATALRGQPLDELVHAAATRRLLTARRAAALVLFEVRRREGPQTPEAAAALYRGLLQRATLALFSDADAGRWPLETDSWLRAAVTLRSAIFAAVLEQHLAALAAQTPNAPAPPTGASPTIAEPAWLRSGAAAAELRQIWQGGRSLRAEDAAQVFGATLDPAALATQVDLALSYVAPDPRPAMQRPDYKYMQGDRRRRVRHRKHKKKR